ncbi:DNA methyltransferase [Corynebacterium accolens]|uniref:DNA methyltransferase n=1 Tax=Corynebacterium accolens TaxID=38284 RepID=UPI00266FA42C|nr:DNA methyltransferase [Corynebacterium accolens]WKS56806.1 DNA methyltransferase [Corynebacterium accolens]
MTAKNTANIGEHQTIPLLQLNHYAKNPRRGDVQAIKGSIIANGIFRPVIVNKGTYTDKPNEILAGNHTVKAIRELAEENPDDPRWQEVEVWMVDVDAERAARIVLADNRTADLGSYDNEELLGLLNMMDGDLDGTGYDEEYLDSLEEIVKLENSTQDPNDEDVEPEAPPAKPTSRIGDVWVLGPHKLLVGDATDVYAVKEMMGDDRADCIWTDPPYGVNYVGKTKDALTIQNDETTDLPDLLMHSFECAVEVSKPGAPVYVAHADTERVTFEGAMIESNIIVRQNLIWAKSTIALGRSDYHYKHEPILYGFTPGGQGRLGRGGNRWYGDNSQSTVFNFDKPSRNADHPTMKPPELIVAMLNNSLPRGGIVLDLFGGSGSTMVAAHQHGSKARLVELDPKYADVICRRFQKLTGTLPERNGKEYDFCADEEH